MPSPDQVPQTRASLIIRLRNRDDLQAWYDFVEIYQPVIYSLAIHRGLQKADAEDVTQEVLSKIAKSIANWNPDPQLGSFRAWLAKVTRNLVIQFFRQQNRLPSTGADSQIENMIGYTEGNATEVNQFDLEHQRQLFLWAARKAQNRFEKQTWQAFWLTAIEGQSVADTAEKLRTTKAQIYVSRSRVMNLLKRIVEQTDFDSQPSGGHSG